MSENRHNVGGPLSRRRFLGATGAAALSLAAALPAQAEALRLAQSRRDELVNLLSDLIRVRSQSGETAGAAQRVVSSYLAGLPYRIEESADRPSEYLEHAEFMQPNPPGDGPFVNLVGWPERTAAPRFALFSHIDTHVIEQGWATDPYTPVQTGSRLYGLGSADDKGGVAAMLVAASLLATRDGPLPVVMSLHGKGGGSRGSLPVFERLRQSGRQLDAVLYVHPAETGRGLEDIKNEVQGVVDLELTVSGWRAEPMEIGSLDSSPWEAGGNALEKCWTTLEQLQKDAFAGVAFNLGTLEGGDRVGSVAESARARFRLKFGGDHTWRELLDAGQRYLHEMLEADAGGTPAYAFSLEPIGYRTNPGIADWDAPASRVLRSSVEDIIGQAPAPYPNHYAGDIRYPIRLLGAPAYGIGSLAGNFYGPDEWVDVDDLVRLVAVIVQTVSGWSQV